MAKNKNNTIDSFQGFFTTDTTSDNHEDTATTKTTTNKKTATSSTKKRVNIYIDADLHEKASYLSWLERKSFSNKLSELISDYAELNKDKLENEEYKTFTD